METIYRSEDFEELNKDKYLLQLVENKNLTKIKHRHDFYEIVLVIRGSITHVMNGNPNKMTSNSFSILSPNDTHFFSAQSKDMKVLSLSITADKFNKIEEAIDFIPVFAKPFLYAENAELLINELLLCSSNVRIQTMNKFLISLLFSCWNELKTRPSIPTHLDSSLQKMCDKENLKKGVSRWCELVGYSRSHLSRLAKKYYNDTPEHIISKLKMRIAEKYLKNTTLSIEEIADVSGFESPARFFVVFKEKHGITPSSFRKNNSLHYQ